MPETPHLFPLEPARNLRFPAGLIGNLALAWRAATRYPTYRITAGLMCILGGATPFLTGSFIYFAEEHAHAEMLASNLFLWTMIFSLLVLPPVAGRISSRTHPAFNALTPASSDSLVLGRYLGLLAAYLAVALVLLILGLVLELAFFSGQLAAVLALTIPLIALGALMVSGIVLFSQAGGVLVSSLTGLIWFLLGTQKSAVVEGLDSTWSSLLFSAGFAWLPDFTLFQIDPYADTSLSPAAAGIGSRAVYSLLFVGLYLILAALVVRTRWGRLRKLEGGD